jgi:uncharacterized protein (TIGR03118 family)
MKTQGSWRSLRAWALTVCLSLSASAAPGQQGGRGYIQTNLVSDVPGAAAHTDANLVNAWGVAFNPAGFVWVADAETGVSTLYDGSGVPSPQQNPLIVEIPSPVAGERGHPTGIVFSGGTDFLVSNGGAPAPARFIFATEEGTLAAWAPQVDFTHALQVVNNAAGGASYKGLALGNGRLFAADFHNGRVDVFDGAFAPVATVGGFAAPALPEGFAPFGVAFLEGKVFVTYALQDEDGEEEVTGRGLGAVDMFDSDGRLLMRVATGGKLNAPWGLAVAPANFGEHSGRLLVGNFGDGRINAYELRGSRFEWRGQLRGSRGPIAIDGLWGLAFGNGVSGQPTNTLFFAAGPADETHGLYGRIDVAPRGGGPGHRR